MNKRQSVLWILSELVIKQNLEENSSKKEVFLAQRGLVIIFSLFNLVLVNSERLTVYITEVYIAVIAVSSSTRLIHIALLVYCSLD